MTAMRPSFISPLVARLAARTRRLRSDPVTRRFKAHNRVAFPAKQRHAGSHGPEILMELNAAHSAHIAYSYLANTLAEMEGARIVAYEPKPARKWWQKAAARLEQALGVGHFGVFRSFGVGAFISPNLSRRQREIADGLYAGFLPQLSSKDDIVRLKIEGVWIGDLVYDTYLRTYSRPTVDKTDPLFLKTLRDTVGLYVFWKDYFDRHDVRSINVSHCVYDVAVPLRIAVSRGISAFQVNVSHVYRLSENNYFAYNDFLNYRKHFAALPDDVKRAGLKQAERQIGRRFAGEAGVDMAYSSKSAYGEVRPDPLLAESPRTKVLIATHCFFDSPHSYGENLFPDFYEWLQFLGEMTKVTDYDWYIKTHPDFLPGNTEIIEEFLRRYPKFTLLPADSSHHQIIAEGIDAALTCYGTIGFEYAALGVPIINASLNNPHIAYDFNVHPRNIAEYEAVIRNLGNVHLDIDMEQVYEYYYMRHHYNSEDLFFENYSDMVRRAGGYARQFSPIVYEIWLREFSEEKHIRLRDGMKRFVASGDFRMNKMHLQPDAGGAQLRPARDDLERLDKATAC